MSDSSQRVLVLGATSAMAEATSRQLAAEGAEFFLVARSEPNLQALSQDLKVRGAKRVAFQALDLVESSKHDELIETARSALGEIDSALIAYGYLGDQKIAQEKFEEAERIIDVNYTSVVSLTSRLADVFEKQGRGSLAVLSSVAGDRGRPSNYVYGSAKAALNSYLQGLRARLFKKGVSVVTIKPGWVDSPMIAHLKPNRLTAHPSDVAPGIALAMKGYGEVVYLPHVWRWIMMVIRMIPERIFKRLSL